MCLKPPPSSTTLVEKLAEYDWKPHCVFLAQKSRSWASIYWYMREKQRGTVSTDLRFQTVQFKQYSANLSLSDVPRRRRGPAFCWEQASPTWKASERASDSASTSLISIIIIMVTSSDVIIVRAARLVQPGSPINHSVPHQVHTVGCYAMLD
jgi:hypothetical protein